VLAEERCRREEAALTELQEVENVRLAASMQQTEAQNHAWRPTFGWAGARYGHRSRSQPKVVRTIRFPEDRPGAPGDPVMARQ